MSELTLESTAGKPKWVNVDDLSNGGRLLIRFDPGENLRIKGATFKVIRVQLDPPMLVLVPAEKGKKP